MLQDLINREARRNGLRLSVKEINHCRDMVSVAVKGQASSEIKAFLASYFPRKRVLVVLI